MEHGQLLLSKVLDENDTAAFKRHAIEPAHFPTEGERQAYEFIRSYAAENRGQAPDYREVIAACPAFDYCPQVESSYEWLAKQLKDHANKRQYIEVFNSPAAQRNLDNMNGEEFLEWASEQIDAIKTGNMTRTKVGTSMKTDAEKVKEEYRKRKAGESLRIWKSRFPFINKAIGGYTSSNMYVVYGKSGRGKSAVTLEEAISLAEQGATVLIWLMEMGWYEGLVRLFTYYSAHKGVAVSEINGIDMEAGFDSRSMRHAMFDDEWERKFFEFVDGINAELDGNIIVRGVDDDDFHNRTLRALEADIIQTGADVVIVDPFYYLDYEKNTSKTTGGDAANTSKKLRRLAGQTQTVIFAITQAEETDGKVDEEGNREMELPKRSGVTKTTALLQDAALLIAVDTNYKEGRGLIGLNKGRDGGEDEIAEIIYLPQIGVIKELEMDNKLAQQFVF
ncbi:DnaB-like helicase C-terminal domain-containing protein [Terribacillus sp. 179-K 1B1 HS]|uniref:DnaB-like helicase C-terminal domain-containing protein n=1 Tax=Terribacillus sp. 179-K 1B1 HS TaxID=3142388 RepID=UPI0039A0D7A6